VNTLAALALVLLCPPPETPARGKKIVLLAGPLDSHPQDSHEYERNIILLKDALDRSLKDVRVEVHFGGWPADPATLDDADTIFFTSGGCDHRLEDHPLYVGDRFKVIEKQMKRGCGIVFHHWSTFHPTKVHDAITEWVGGYFDYETGTAPNHWYSKIETKDYTTVVNLPDHPIARGVKPFKVKEEFYFNLRFREHDPRLKLILLKDGGDPRASAVGWAVERADGGRGWGFTGGHFFANWWIPEFRKLVLNAIAWTAKIDVPPGGIESALEEPVRALILTGHNHPAHDWRTTTTALIHVLEQDPRMKVEVTENPEDLAGKRMNSVDLLVLNYNNWDKPGLSAEAKSGFLKYVERGGGLSVIHFADGAWNKTLPAKDSEWEEYRTKIVRRAWMHPDSAHDPFGAFKVVPTSAKHEITAGLEAFDTSDELYFKQAGDQPIEPLMTAKSKVTNDDEPMAWAYDVGAARVFQTVLGHSADSIRSAAALIRRGSAWASKRTPLSFDPPTAGLAKATFRSGARWTGQAPKQAEPPKPPPPKVLPSDPGLDGGEGGHWGKTGENDWVDNRWNLADVGPFMTSAIKVGDETILRAISIKTASGGVVFDPDRLTVRAAWTGGFLNFSPARYGLIEKPKIAGDVQWTSSALQKGEYLGLAIRGERVELHYRLGDVKVRQRVRSMSAEGLTATVLTFVYDMVDKPPVFPLLVDPSAALEKVEGQTLAVIRSGDRVTAVGSPYRNEPPRVAEGGRVELRGYLGNAIVGSSSVAVWTGPAASLPAFARLVGAVETTRVGEFYGPQKPSSLGAKSLETRGQTSRDKGPYVVDTLTVPYDNPWKALMFLSGVDFFRNGDAAVSTIHGDVWIVSGIDEKLDHLNWKRYATGLYQALGLRIVGDEVFVIGRDRITKLRDLNGDGVADEYENFCGELPTTDRGHDYITCLETDAAGNFYFVSWHGLYKVSPDGKKVELISTGFRNPNGMSVGPDGMITVAPQEGEWTPASCVTVATAGSYHGYGGPKVTPERPLGYEPPLCWIPRGVDNSTGGQVWVTSDRWGPLKGALLSFSFGQSSMMLVTREQVDGVWQGGVVPMKLGFASGAIRGRFNPKDGQLYVAGTKGWVSNATRDGCLQRVRFTGEKVRLPVEIHAAPGALRLRFTEPLDKEIAADPDSWSAEMWNYKYAADYGSKEYSVANAGVEGHDALEIKGAKLSDDGREATLEIPGLRPAMQVRVRYSLRSADGAPVKGEIDSTIHRLGR
jgi:type 1 glutamine amidotransferase